MRVEKYYCDRCSIETDFRGSFQVATRKELASERTEWHETEVTLCHNCMKIILEKMLSEMSPLQTRLDWCSQWVPELDYRATN